jgi:predicted AlkP superfamily phosphohydrolase/phosphomutase
VLAVFQFDAVSVPLLRRLLDEGRLPTLAGLISQGRWLDLETPATHFPAASYFSLYSGVPVVDHGLYHAFQWQPAEQRVRWRGDRPGPPTVWERVGRARRRVLVLDPYESLRPEQLNGIALSGWQFLNVVSLDRWSVPHGADNELVRVFGRPPRLEEVFGRPTPRRLLALSRLLQRATERVADAAVYLLQRGEYDLVWMTFLASHLGGHMLWSLSEVDPSRLDARMRAQFDDALPRLYEQIDDALGRVIAALPADAGVVVMSALGMGENIVRVDLLPAMLEAVLSGRRAESRSEGFLWRLRAAVPVGARAKVAAALHGPLTREVTMRLSNYGVDWAKTPAFVVPSDHFGQIRFNLRGREREGIVAPEDVDGLAEEIRAGLLSFRDPDGEPAVHSVERTSEVLGDGKGLEFLPDLVVRWSLRPSAKVTHVTSPSFGEIRRAGRGSGRSGSHLPEAWALIVPATAALAANGRPHVVDIAPSVCAALGVDPGELPGKPFLAGDTATIPGRS